MTSDLNGWDVVVDCPVARLNEGFAADYVEKGPRSVPKSMARLALFGGADKDTQVGCVLLSFGMETIEREVVEPVCCMRWFILAGAVGADDPSHRVDLDDKLYSLLLTVEAPGMQGTIAPDTKEIRLQIRPGSRVRVRVLDRAGKPVAYAPGQFCDKGGLWGASIAGLFDSWSLGLQNALESFPNMHSFRVIGYLQTPPAGPMRVQLGLSTNQTGGRTDAPVPLPGQSPGPGDCLHAHSKTSVMRDLIAVSRFLRTSYAFNPDGTLQGNSSDVAPILNCTYKDHKPLEGPKIRDLKITFGDKVAVAWRTRWEGQFFLGSAIGLTTPLKEHIPAQAIAADATYNPTATVVKKRAYFQFPPEKQQVIVNLAQ